MITQQKTIYVESHKEGDPVRKKPSISLQAKKRTGDSVIPEVSQVVVSEVKDELAREDAKATIEQEEKLMMLTKKSNEVLFICKSVFPFDLFPDILSIEPTQINIKKKSFFKSHHLLTIPIKNISDIHVLTSPFFSTLRFIDRSFADNTIQIAFLKNGDAQEARRILQGLVIASGEGIAVDKLDTVFLKDQTEKLGSMNEME